MNKFKITVGLILLGLSLMAQELQHESVVVNIEIPVRVFSRDDFVSDLTIRDFEVYEDGKIQEIEAVYLIKEAEISREESRTEIETARQKFAPQLSRHFILVFELYEFLPKIRDAVDYFFTNVLLPGDTLKVVTPLKAYLFKNQSFGKLTGEKIAEQMLSRLRTDITMGNSQYRSLIDAYDNLMNREILERDLKLNMAKDILRQLRDLHEINEKNLVDFAEYLKQTDGQKHVFLFYQKYEIPFPQGLSDWDMFELMKKPAFDIKKINQAFADSSISSHFLYIPKPKESSIEMEWSDSETLDQSGPIYSAFSKVAVATGGLVESSVNPAYAFKKATDAAENYYLIYYTPKIYKANGKFRKIDVKVKGNNYRVLHRAGYIAD